jgi:hypothetical protein
MDVTFPAELRPILDIVLAKARQDAKEAATTSAHDLAVGAIVARGFRSIGCDLTPSEGYQAWDLWSLNQAAGCLDLDASASDQEIINSFALLCESLRDHDSQYLTLTDLMSD